MLVLKFSEAITMRQCSFLLLLIIFLDIPTWCQYEHRRSPTTRKWARSTVTCLGKEAQARLAGRAEYGDVAAQDTLGTLYTSRCEGSYDTGKGVALLQRAATAGNGHAQFELALAYEWGDGVPKDKAIAVSWLEKAAAQGNEMAQNNLGLAYESGDGVKKDAARAVMLFQAAAEQDLPEAAFNLATMYDRGAGIQQDYAAARKWYQLAAERRDADAEYRLAVLLEEGLGGDKNPALASRWFKRAAHDGSVHAQIKLGLRKPDLAPDPAKQMQFEIASALLSGKGGAADAARAHKIMQELAGSGYVPAYYMLGRMYSTGLGVGKDEAKGMAYYEQAIQGDPEDDSALNSLAWLCVTADDPKLRDPLKALQYATRAVQLSGGAQANELDTLAHAYFAVGNIDKALEIEGKALALEPESEFFQKAIGEYRAAKAKAGKK
jgi:TPR repeat protein